MWIVQINFEMNWRYHDSSKSNERNELMNSINTNAYIVWNTKKFQFSKSTCIYSKIDCKILTKFKYHISIVKMYQIDLLCVKWLFDQFSHVNWSSSQVSNSNASIWFDLQIENLDLNLNLNQIQIFDTLNIMSRVWIDVLLTS